MSAEVFWRLPVWCPGLAPETLQKLSRYHRELLKFTTRVNLISRATETIADEVHFADCVMAAQILAPHLSLDVLYDLGSGNGLPGLVIALLRPELQVVLVESDSRKVEFLKHVAHQLSMGNVTIKCERVESLKFSAPLTATARGFAAIDRTFEFCAQFPVGSLVYHLKGSGWIGEVEAIREVHLCAWRTESIGSYHLPITKAERVVLRSQRFAFST